jgi:hypothetical protein
LIAPVAGAALLTIGQATLWLTVGVVGVISGASVLLLAAPLQHRQSISVPAEDGLSRATS